MYTHLIEFKFKTAKSNVKVETLLLNSKWNVSWNNNIVIAKTFYKYPKDKRNFADIFDKASTITAIDIGNLIDILTFCSDLMIDTGYEYTLCPITNKTKRKPTFENTILGASKEHGSGLNLFPERIDKARHETKNIEIIKSLLDSFQDKKLIKTEVKLLNYWRRGFDLGEFGFFEESFLNFFKIIEYFINSAQIKQSDIPVEYRGSKKIMQSYRLLKHLDMPVTKDKIELVTNFIDIRNNFDVAHQRIRTLPQERAMGLYFSYVEGVWDLHDHIQEISRLLILKKLSFTDYLLVRDGGLLHLQCKT